jgi:hypothetical protein
MMGSRGTGTVMEVPFGAEAITDFLTVLRLLAEPEKTKAALEELASAHKRATEAVAQMDAKSAELDKKTQVVTETRIAANQSSLFEAKASWDRELVAARQSLSVELEQTRKQHTDRLTRERTAWATEKAATDREFADAMARLKADQAAALADRRDLEAGRAALSAGRKDLEDRATALEAREAELNELTEAAQALKQEYEQKLAALKALAA